MKEGLRVGSLPEHIIQVPIVVSGFVWGKWTNIKTDLTIKKK